MSNETKVDDRVRSEFCDGTVKEVRADGSLRVHWDKSPSPCDVSADVAAGLVVVGFVASEDFDDREPTSYRGCQREDFHSDG